MKKSGLLTTLSVKGDSAMAMANAQAVEDAEDTVNTDVMEAASALEAAEMALEDVDETSANSDELIAALDAAIEVAEDAVKTTEDQSGSKTLADALKAVRGNDPDDDDYPMTPYQYAKMVAMDIGGALMPASVTDGAVARGAHGNTVAAAPTDPEAVDSVASRMNDHQGETWAEIVGATTKMRVDTDTDEATHLVDAASIANMPTSSVTTPAELAGAGLANGAEHAGNYEGIPGRVFCAGADCKVAEGSDEVERLTGSWYFTPTTPKEWYVKLTADADYTVETMYVRFGHWLSTDSDGDTEINTYALTAANTAGLDVTTVDRTADATTLTDSSATYSGRAVGISLHKEVDSDGGIVPNTLTSAQFTALVELTATFATAPTLGGKIYDFKGDATDPDWNVKLLPTAFEQASVADGVGTSVATGQDGEWSAQGYGNSGERPEGIFGGFNAHFLDGHAAGAYATRKD